MDGTFNFFQTAQRYRVFDSVRRDFIQLELLHLRRDQRRVIDFMASQAVLLEVVLDVGDVGAVRAGEVFLAGVNQLVDF